MANEMAKAGRRANRDKALRLTAGDPRKKVDASSWTPPESLNAGRKTGARPIRPRIYKIGGKVQGDRMHRDPGKQRRASGGKVGTGPLSMANVADENKKDFGSYHEGAYKRGGKAKGGSSYNKEAVDKEIAKDKRIGKGEASKIHRLLKGRSAWPTTGEAEPPEFGAGNSATADDRRSLRSMFPTTGEKRGGRSKHASGGRAKGKTNIRITINAKPDQPQMMPQQGVVRPPPPPPPPPQMPPPAAGGPGGPPGGAPMGPPGPPPMMGRKAGGRTYRKPADMDAGSESGLGRLEKIEIQKHSRA